jgi:transcription-repair coupling factor (superfamily II helicase)
LGGEQSGFINEIGFDTYQKILSEAITELKENEFADLYETNNVEKKHVTDVTVDSDFELLFPDDYINSISERLVLYSKLNEVQDEKGLDTYKRELTDRFGELPEEAENLLTSVRIKWVSTRLGLEKIVMKEGKFVGYFISDQKSGFYQSESFSRVLKAVQNNPKILRMKEKQTRAGLRLLLTVENVRTVDRVYDILNAIMPVSVEV